MQIGAGYAEEMYEVQDEDKGRLGEGGVLFVAE
jgi:hypothetical protein